MERCIKFADTNTLFWQQKKTSFHISALSRFGFRKDMPVQIRIFCLKMESTTRATGIYWHETRWTGYRELCRDEKPKNYGLPKGEEDHLNYEQSVAVRIPEEVTKIRCKCILLRSIKNCLCLRATIRRTKMAGFTREGFEAYDRTGRANHIGGILTPQLVWKCVYF